MTWKPKRDSHRANDSRTAAAELLDILEAAYRDVLVARQAFNAVSDPESVEPLVHQLNAAETNYRRLLRQARAAGLTGRIVLR